MNVFYDNGWPARPAVEETVVWIGGRVEPPGALVGELWLSDPPALGDRLAGPWKQLGRRWWYFRDRWRRRFRRLVEVVRPTEDCGCPCSECFYGNCNWCDDAEAHP